MTGPHCCQAGGPNSLNAMMTANVTAATAGAAACGTPSGVFDNLLSRTDMTVADSNMRTVPETTGVMNRRNSESRETSANWSTAETMMRLDSMVGPPATSALMQTAM